MIRELASVVFMAAMLTLPVTVPTWAMVISNHGIICARRHLTPNSVYVRWFCAEPKSEEAKEGDHVNSPGKAGAPSTPIRFDGKE